MDVRVAGHQVDTGESLREHAQRRVADITDKYFSRSVGANVTFGRGPNNDFTCDILAPVAQGMVLKASYSAREAEMAFNGAADRALTTTSSIIIFVSNIPFNFNRVLAPIVFRTAILIYHDLLLLILVHCFFVIRQIVMSDKFCRTQIAWKRLFS